MKLLFIILLLGLAFAHLVHSEEPDTVAKAIVSQSRLIVLMNSGCVKVWSLKDRKPDHEFAQQISKIRPQGLDADDAHIWRYDGSKIDVIEDNGASVSLVAKAAKTAEPMEFFRTQDGYFGIYVDGIENLITGSIYKVPALGGQLKTTRLSPLCYARGPHTIWIGTGYGEWGGHLVGFNTKKGKWAWKYDGLHYVTGIAVVGDDPKIVTWSMSHFMASTVIRVHDSAANEVESFREEESKYYQAAAFNRFDKKFYGIEQTSLGTIDGQGTFKVTTELPKVNYRREPRAIGVAPSVKSIIPIGPDSLVIVYHEISPILISDRKIFQFEESSWASDR